MSTDLGERCAENIYHASPRVTAAKPDFVREAAKIINSEHEKEVQPLIEALQEISKGAGAYNRDPLEHASNCITEMKALAVAALARASQKGAAAQ